MEFISKKVRGWLMPTVLILFLLLVVTVPFMAGITYAGSGEAPNHVLTYTPGTLKWESGIAPIAIDEIQPDGALELNLFGEEISPGSSGGTRVRLQNNAGGTVEYTVVLYKKSNNPALKETIQVSLEPYTASVYSRSGEPQVPQIPLPEGVSGDDVAITSLGSLKGKEIQEFTLTWNWEFETDRERNQKDTELGIQAADLVTVGMYVVVEDNNNYALPQTGDSSNISTYMVLLGISAVVLVLLVAERFRKKK